MPHTSLRCINPKLGSCRHGPDGNDRWTVSRQAALSGADPGLLAVEPIKEHGPPPQPQRLVLDKGYDIGALPERLAEERGINAVSPHRKNRKRPPLQDGRPLRRYKRRWKVDRSFAWLGNFRRLVVRYEQKLSVYQGFFHVACLLSTLR